MVIQVAWAGIYQHFVCLWPGEQIKCYNWRSISFTNYQNHISPYFVVRLFVYLTARRGPFILFSRNLYSLSRSLSSSLLSLRLSLPPVQIGTHAPACTCPLCLRHCFFIFASLVQTDSDEAQRERERER